MHIPDRDEAERYLAHLNYYRLAGYWLCLEEDHDTHRFRRNTTFDDVIKLYVFDREIRLLLLDAIERVEVSVRTQYAYHLSHLHGPHAYLIADLSWDRKRFDYNLSRLKEEIDRSKEPFIKHYKKKYTVPEEPPIWSVCEVMSLGALSHFYANLKYPFQRAIAKTYQLDADVLKSFLHHLTYIRNRCAHHCRLWNARFTITMALPKNKPHSLRENLSLEQTEKLYNTCVMLKWFLDRISPSHQWERRLIQSIDKYHADTKSMGFPKNFESLPIWQGDLGTG